jgi:hypothetical protein
VGTVWVEGVKYPVVNGTFDVVVKLAKGKNRITVEVVDPAGNAREEEVAVRYGATGFEAGVLVVVVVDILLVRWVMLGGREKRGRPHVVPSRGAG